MRTPSIKTLSAVFENPREAKRILQMSRAELEQLPAGMARVRECYHAPSNWDVRLTCLSAIEPGLHGVESCETTKGRRIAYLNTGDTYALTLIYDLNGRYRVQSLGDYVELCERSHVRFN